MQTFHTRVSYGGTARDLDNTRLFNQVNEAAGIFDHLTGVKPKFYPNHPVMFMWRGYEYALAIYAMMCCMELTGKRGYADVKKFWFFSRAVEEMKKEDRTFVYEPPPWLRDVNVILAYRSNLARKDPQLYGSKWNNCPKNWPYLWPVVDDEGGYELKIAKTDKTRMRTGERAMLPDDVMELVTNWP